jgi:hypothetical protein
MYFLKPFGLCFGVIPTCQKVVSNGQVFDQLNQRISPTKSYSLSAYSNSLANHFLHSVSNQNDQNSLNEIQIKQDNSLKSEFTNSLLICQIVSLNEDSIYELSNTHTKDMITGFDFYVEDRFSIVTWSRDKYLCIYSLDLEHFSNKEFERIANVQTIIKKDEDDLSNIIITNKLGTNTSNLMPQSNTTNSSRKSSISEYTYGTPPSTGYLGTRANTNEREGSINLNEELQVNERTSISTSFTKSASFNLLKSSSSAHIAHEFLKRNPKCFGAKFSGLPGKNALEQ